MGVPPSHLAFRVEYDDVDVDVHGGLTFSGTQDGEGDVWWLGFDCAHAGDLVPGHVVNTPGATFKDLGYVRDQCRLLAEQLAGPLKIRRWRIEG